MISIFSHKGQSLLELVVSIGLLVIVVTALAITTVNGLRNSQLSENQTLATKFAQEGLDNVKNIKARNCRVTITGASPSTYYWYDFGPAKPNNLWTNATVLASGLNFQVSPTASPCNMTSSTTGAENILNGRFVRVINMKRVDDTAILVSSTVTWEDSNGPHKSMLTTYLTNY